MRQRGDIVFNENLTDVASLSDGGYLILRIWSRFIPHTIEVRSDGGQLTHSYFVAGAPRPFGREARQRLQAWLPGLVRHGLGAEGRTRQILESRGVAGVLEEITRLESDWARSTYFRQLFQATRLDSSNMTKALLVVAAEMSSDFERSRTLQSAAPVAALDHESAEAYTRVADGISSDFERRRALVALLRVDGQAAAVAGLIARSAGRMGSDFEKAQVLRALIAGPELSSAARRGVLDAVSTMGSDFERARVLTTMLDLEPLEGDWIAAATRQVGSDFEKSRVLRGLIARRGLSVVARRRVLDAASTIGSDFERSRVLRAMLSAGPLDATLRDDFLRVGK